MKNSSNSSLGFGTILFIIFLVLKLIGVITWSWWWVTAPLWIPIGLWLFITMLCLIFFPKDFKAGMWKALKK